VATAEKVVGLALQELKKEPAKINVEAEPKSKTLVNNPDIGFINSGVIKNSKPAIKIKVSNGFKNGLRSANFPPI